LARAPNALAIGEGYVEPANPLTRGTPTLADAWAFNADAMRDYIARQRALAEQHGLWNPATGMPTQKGWTDAAQQYAGTFEGGIQGKLSLQTVHPRTLRPLAKAPDYEAPGSHTFSIKGPDGQPVGTVDTTWNPETGNLHVEDFQSEQGKNSLGLGAIRQIRELLLSYYPQAQTLSGQRITGAVSADRASGSGPGRAATQTIRAEE